LASPGIAFALYDTEQVAKQVGDVYQNLFYRLSDLADYYFSYVYFLLSYQGGQDQCVQALYGNYQTVMNATEKLFNYFYYYNLGNPRVLRNEYVKACDNGVCGQAAMALVQAITGDGSQGCDLLQAIHDGLAERAFY